MDRSVFHDPDENTEALFNTWGMDMRIAATGPFHCELQTAECGAISCLTVKMTPYIFELGTRATTFVFLDKGSPPIWRSGVEITDRHMFALPSQKGYLSRHEYFCVANAAAVLDAELARLFNEPFSGQQAGHALAPVVGASPTDLSRGHELQGVAR